MATKQEVQIFRSLLSESLSGQDLNITGGENPFHIVFDGKEYWLYIKKITSAHFKNSDVSRAQFPSRDIFNQIKKSDVDFVLLGYDKDNDIFATWNPRWVKQRINDRENISEYSRFSIQKESRDVGQFIHRVLSNDVEVVVFPCEKLGEYLSDMQVWFQAQGDYVAVGSKSRSEANEAFRIFKTASNLTVFAPYLAEQGLASQDIAAYCRIIQRLIKDGYFSRNRKLFYQYDSLTQYSSTIDRFLSVEEVAAKDEEWGHKTAPALLAYIDFLIQRPVNMKPSEMNLPLDFTNTHDTSSVAALPTGTYTIYDEESHALREEHVISYGMSRGDESSSEQLNAVHNWEAEYTDPNGKWTKIANPEVIDLLRPALAGEYQTPLEAYNILEDYYGERLPKMSLQEWSRLLNNIDWDDPYVHENSQEHLSPSPAAEVERTIQTRVRTHTLRVEFPDGHAIQEKVVGDTYIAVIKEIEPDLVELVELSHSGVPIVSKTLDERYAKYQKPIGDGWYVMTNSSTNTKYQDLLKISETLELGLKVYLIPITESE